MQWDEVSQKAAKRQKIGEAKKGAPGTPPIMPPITEPPAPKKKKAPPPQWLTDFIDLKVKYKEANSQKQQAHGAQPAEPPSDPSAPTPSYSRCQPALSGKRVERFV